MNTDNLKLIKTSEYGNKALNIENELYKKIILELYNNELNLISLSKNINVNDLELVKLLNKCEKAKLIGYKNNKFFTDFIILNKESTDYLTNKLLASFENIFTKIVEILNKNKNSIQNILGKNINFENVFQTLLLISIDFICENIFLEVSEKLKFDNYNKSYVITGFVSQNDNHIFRDNNINFNVSNNIKKLGLYSYGDGSRQKFNKDLLDSLVTFNTNDYVNFIYVVYNILDLVNKDVYFDIIKFISNSIPKYLSSQVCSVFQNQISLLRFHAIKYCLDNNIIKQYNSSQFIIIHDN